MKLFTCQNCGQLVHFENIVCERCGYSLGYIAERGTMSALKPDGDHFVALADNNAYRYCANEELGACNWLVGDGEEDSYCESCALNLVIPDLSIDDHKRRWVKIEQAKRRLVYSLMCFGLPVEPKADGDESPGIGFRFLADSPNHKEGRVLTGHADGVVTINIDEADPVSREAARRSMGEAYRTMLGHFRHEIGHYYWDVLIAGNDTLLSRCRELFGDDRADYGEALEHHYANGAPPDWPSAYISAYATTHPWEDWAETFAHYLHMIDTMETAFAFGLRAMPRSVRGPDRDDHRTDVGFNPYRMKSFDTIIDAWPPLTVLMNSLNRSMGQADLYPFVLSGPVIDKLAFVHEAITSSGISKPSASKAEATC